MRTLFLSILEIGWLMVGVNIARRNEIWGYVVLFPLILFVYADGRMNWGGG